jgi:hypothetical protein
MKEQERTLNSIIYNTTTLGQKKKTPLNGVRREQQQKGNRQNKKVQTRK